MNEKEITGALNKVIEIDLSTRSVQTVSITENQRQKFLGGKGLGLKLMYDRLKPGIDPLGEENIILFMTGVLAGTSAPCSGRFHAVFKSPLTNIIGSSSCGGSFGRMLKTSGWDGLIIRGKSSRPVFLKIHHDQVEFLDAKDLWGKDISTVQAQIGKKENETIVIGPAGENRVRFANAASGYRYLGRGGLGAVMGSKNLKALVAVRGQYKVVPFFPIKFEKLKNRANRYINRNSMSLLMREYGTAANAEFVIRNRMLPVNNFSFGNHKKAIGITGQQIKAQHDTKHHTCKPCSILCGHKGMFNNTIKSVPEYETLALLGSNIGIFDPNAVSLFNDICNEKGMDTISAGGTLAWTMEAAQKGIVTTDLEFGNSDQIIHALNTTAYLEGFGKDMAMGSRALSEKFGGKEFAIQVKGLEMAGYDPRGAYGQGLGYAVANRGACHLSSFPVAFENFLGFLKPDTIRAKPEFVKFFENFYAALNSMDICQFTGYGFTLETFLTRMTPRFLLAFLMQNLPSFALSLVDFSIYPDMFEAVTGMKLSSREFLVAGERIHMLERLMNTTEGIRKKDDTLPDRLLFEHRKDDPERKSVPLNPMIDRYYKLRGYNNEGIPESSFLKRLEI
ncbi:MAG: aldehyde ferredoxin oxidoreductase [Bdellovibrionales bacterium RIFOXYB2_FULL_36_6]|nr:MAG: aldehyde ferredoxin oxidoreductase [Bdellovibrionales bacterium RIFOXYB2_FULL_36_6]